MSISLKPFSVNHEIDYVLLQHVYHNSPITTLKSLGAFQKLLTHSTRTRTEELTTRWRKVTQLFPPYVTLDAMLT